MGRIADALKRAEEERRRTTGSGSVGVLPCAPPPPTTSANVEAPEPPVIPEPSVEVADSPPLVQGLSESLIPYYQRSSLISEQYRSLRTRLLSQNPQHEHRVLAVTSAVPREGKSVTTLNLGCILGEVRHLRVLVVDADFRRSSLARMLNQPHGPGLADVLAGKASYTDVIRNTPIPNMMFLPAGNTDGRSASELLASASAQPVFQRMQNEFHYTIVDTPPATTVTDVGIIGQMCTGVIMLVRLHRTLEVAAKRAVRLLQVNNIPIVGCLLVGRDMPSGRYGYGGAYGYNYYRYANYYQSADAGDG